MRLTKGDVFATSWIKFPTIINFKFPRRGQGIFNNFERRVELIIYSVLILYKWKINYGKAKMGRKCFETLTCTFF